MMRSLVRGSSLLIVCGLILSGCLRDAGNGSADTLLMNVGPNDPAKLLQGKIRLTMVGRQIV